MKERRTTKESRKSRGLLRPPNATPKQVMAWIESRFFAAPNGCFLWEGSVGGPGYGDFRWRDKTRTVHRFVLEYHTGPLGSLQALHTCDNRLCGRREHLFRGTALDNTQDMVAKSRQRFEGLKLMQQRGAPRP